MTILVTGATGKVGSRLARHLAARGDQVRVLVRDPSRAEVHPNIEIVKGDLLDVKSLEAAVKNVEAIVHCAAFFRGATPEQAHEVNDLGTRHLAHAARGAGAKRFIFTSTGLVYGPTGNTLVNEDAPCSPSLAYPVSKLAAEKFLFSLDGLDVRVLRLPFVYGDGDPHVAEIIPHMRTFSPTQRMSLAHHADVSQAAALLLDAKSPSHRIYNVVDDEPVTIGDLYASVGAPAPDGTQAAHGGPFDALMDGKRLREDLGFKPKYPRYSP